MPKDFVILWKINFFIFLNPSFTVYNSKLVKCLFFSSLANTKRTALFSRPLLVKANTKCSLIVRNWHTYHQGCSLSNQSQILPVAVALWSCFSHPDADVTLEDRAQQFDCPAQKSIQHHISLSKATALQDTSQTRWSLWPHSWSSAMWIMAFQG